MCSSTASLGKSLERFADGELVTPEYRTKALHLAATAAAISENAKLDALGDVLNQHREQVIVFSEHLPTLEMIARRVSAHGRHPVLYQGGLSRHDRSRRLQAFRSTPDGVFVSTRAGTEGLNLQFCNVLVNYELPWNPMVVEQRIGRIHRIGQTRDEARGGDETRVKGWRVSRDARHVVVQLDLGWTRRLVVAVPHGGGAPEFIVRHSIFGSTTVKG
ncbi:MAG: C-terminal helicase domain-containing protein [Gemmatimonadota bacterium]